ncbi:hypothetical protein ACLKA7_006396 [Drosophila subpalustris]
MLLLLMLMVGAAVGYDGSVNYWEAFAPGKLLQRLDALTLTEGGQLPVEQQLPIAQAKLDEHADEEVGETEGDVDVEEEEEEEGHDDPADGVDIETVDSSAEAHSGEDYERNYEQFVRQYFDRVPEEDDDHEEHAEQPEDDSSIETQAEASNVQRQQKQKPKDRHKRQHCRRVRKQGQLCRICREPRNNEVSETCSYSHEAEPEQYAYGSGSQYKRYRDQSSPDDGEEEEEEQKRPQRSERHTTVVQPNDDAKNSSSSLCVRRLQGKSICYECKDSAGKRMRRCYDAAIKMKRSHKKPRNSKQSKQEQEQRIYKRTISYSYAQDSSQDGEQMNPKLTTTQSSPIPSRPSAAPSTGRRFIKLLRRRTPIPHITA